MRRVGRGTAVQFALIGGLLFAGERWWPAWTPRPGVPERRPSWCRVRDVERWRREWTLRTGVAPTAAQEAALLDDAIDDEVLLREAVARGFDRRGSRRARASAVTLGRYLGLGPGADDAASSARRVRSPSTAPT